MIAACVHVSRICDRALKTKHETPKYGLIYHASLIGQSQPKFKGKISRVLAAKCALAIRVDALGDTTDATIGTEARAKVSEAQHPSHACEHTNATCISLHVR